MPMICRKVLLLGSILLLAGVSALSAGEYSFEYQKILDVTEPLNLDIVLQKGAVTVTGSEDGRVIIEAVKIVRASNREEAEEVADHIEIKVTPSSGKITVATNYLKMINRNSSFWSKFFGTGDSESYGAVKYNIKVPTRTSVSISGMDALVELNSLEGEQNVKTNVGETKGSYLFGSVTVSQPVGEISLEWIDGDIRVKSNSSRINIKQLKGAIDLSTYSSAVHIETELQTPRDYFVETTSGSITFSIPASAAGRLKVETQTGQISTDIPITVKSATRSRLLGEIGQGGPTVHILSTTGDVDVVEF